MKKFRSFVSNLVFNKRFQKIFACYLLMSVLFSFIIIPSSANEFTAQTISPISVSDFSGYYSLAAFPGPHSEPLDVDGTIYRTFLTNDDYLANSSRILTDTFDGQTVDYIQIYLICRFESVYLNTQVYSSNSFSDPYVLFGVTKLEFLPVSHSYDANQTYSYVFNIVLGSYVNQSDVFQEGYLAGVNSSDAKDKWYQEGYDQGLQDGFSASDSSMLGQNLIGDTLSAPLRALNSFTLFKSPSGVEVSLGMIFGSMIALVLFIAFLKMFGG